MPQLRQNPITGHWVVVAPERAKRPTDFVQPVTETEKSHEKCLFCVGGKVYQERLENFESDEVYVAPNKFPAFIENPVNASARSFEVENGFYRARPAVGGHDILIVKNPDHDLLSFTQPVWNDLLTTFQQRMIYYRDIVGAESSMPIYNHKLAGGASVDHPHAQLFASSVVPNQLAREVHNAYDHHMHNGSCIFCDLVEHEQKEKVRILAESDHFVAFTFYAARFPFEAWILPKKHADRFENSPADVITDLAKFLPSFLAKYRDKLNNPPMNFFIHSLSNSLDQADFFHWHMEIVTRLSNYGGFELGSGMVIDVVSPEHAADFLRSK